MHTFLWALTNNIFIYKSWGQVCYVHYNSCYSGFPVVDGGMGERMVGFITKIVIESIDKIIGEVSYSQKILTLYRWSKWENWYVFKAWNYVKNWTLNYFEWLVRFGCLKRPFMNAKLYFCFRKKLKMLLHFTESYHF